MEFNYVEINAIKKDYLDIWGSELQKRVRNSFKNIRNGSSATPANH